MDRDNRVYDVKAAKIIDKVVPGWNRCHNVSTSCKDNIWVLWNPNIISLTDLERYAQLIHGYVKLHHSTKEFQFSKVYGLHAIQDRKSSWDMIRDTEGQIVGPWFWEISALFWRQQI